MSDTIDEHFDTLGTTERFAGHDNEHARANGEYKSQRQDRCEEPNGATKTRFPLVPFEELTPGTARSYLIKDLIPRIGLTVVWGPPKCGKSFWVFDAMIHVALGWSYRGRRVVQGSVVYCALEGAEGFNKRAEAFRRKHFQGRLHPPPTPFFLVPARFDLVSDHDDLGDSIAARLGGTSPHAIVLDTLNRSLIGSESKDEDMGRYIAAADALRARFGCTIIIVHHCGVDGSRPRGHTSLGAAVDAQLAVTRDKANNSIRVEVEWMKDGREGDIIVSQLETVEVGTDEDGETITSCVVEPVGEADAQSAKSRPAKMPKGAQTALRALRQALEERGVQAPAEPANHIPPGVTVTTIVTWREYAYRRGISASDEPRAKQQAFKRASECLIGTGEAVVWEPYVWARS